MKTLETMVEGTKVGSYLAVIYGVILIIAASITFTFQLNQAIEQEVVNTQKVAQYYQLSESSADGVICHQGMLHYSNVGLYSGVLAFNPAIACTKNELQVLQDNPSAKVATIAFFVLLLGLVMLIFSRIDLKEGLATAQ